MKTIIHLSDLHFGNADHTRVKPLLDSIESINPDMVIISGDFTERATEKQFKEAKEFIDALKRPVFVVPGNHDIPLYNLFRRFFKPFDKYTTFISDNLSPVYTDNEIALIGINSVRNFTITSGRISNKQIKDAEQYLEKLHPDLIKIVVCHHPFEVPKNTGTFLKQTHKEVARSKQAVKRLVSHGTDLFLSGHLHVHHIGDTTMRYKTDNYTGLIVQAGTPISKRVRGQPVSFNVLHVDKNQILIDHYAGEKQHPHYGLAKREQFVSTGKGWKKESKPTV